MSADLAGLWAVVVNWNGGRANQECLAALVAAGVEPARIVFVDNGSVDGSLAAVRAAFPGLVFVEHDRNRGFGEGANAGARVALAGGAELVFFVNNDLVVPPATPAALAAELATAPEVGVVGPRLLYPGEPARVWCAGGRLDWRQNLSTLLGHGRPDGDEWRARREVDYVAGAALLARRAVLEEVGLFEADYFAYMEDVELCLRVRQAGWKVVVLGAVAAVHEASSATGGGYNARRKYMQGVNSVHFLRRYGGPRAWLRFAFFDVLSLPPLLLAGAVRGRARAVLAKGLGIWHGLRGRRVTAERLAPGASRLW